MSDSKTPESEAPPEGTYSSHTDEEERMVRVLRERGYDIRKKATYVKKTLEINKAVLDDFLSIQRESGLKLKEATDIALSDWIEKNKNKGTRN